MIVEITTSEGERIRFTVRDRMTATVEFDLFDGRLPKEKVRILYGHPVSPLPSSDPERSGVTAMPA